MLERNEDRLLLEDTTQGDRTSCLTIRELGAPFRASKWQAYRILGNLIPRLANLLGLTVVRDRRWPWIMRDPGSSLGTMWPRFARRTIAGLAMYRLVRWCDLRGVEVLGGGPGNRNDPVRYRGCPVEALCRKYGSGYRGINELLTRSSSATESFAMKAGDASASVAQRGERPGKAQGLVHPPRSSPTRPVPLADSGDSGVPSLLKDLMREELRDSSLAYLEAWFLPCSAVAAPG